MPRRAVTTRPLPRKSEKLTMVPFFLFLLPLGGTLGQNTRFHGLNYGPVDFLRRI